MAGIIYDIFSGSPDREPLWLQSLEGLPEAKKRMEQIAAYKPGRYFVFSLDERRVVAQLDTIKNSAGTGDA